MIHKLAFDNDAYLKTQSENILKRIQKFDNKLYLEFGGKLFDDFHASRVLPGFLFDSKIRMLMEMKEQIEVVIVISAIDIQKNKIRSDIGIGYDNEVLRLIDAFRESDLYVGSVVISQYTNQENAIIFKTKLENLGIKVYIHYPITGYPTNVSYILSDQGFGKNEYIETIKPLVVVTAPGPGSGKMATCLSQLYHEQLHGKKAGYAKYETFPIWNLPLKHPVNLAYEAATADLNDVNMIDPFHLEYYNVLTVNYNRDVEVFPVLKTIFEKIYGKSPYQSPTDMGVNMAGNCIINDEVAIEASKQEIIRRYLRALVDLRNGKIDDTTIEKIELIMNSVNGCVSDRKTVKAALDKEESSSSPSIAIELHNGKIITGKTSSLLGASAALLLNALKFLCNIDEDIMIISPFVIEPIQRLKIDRLGNRNPRLHADEVLIALAITANTNPIAEMALAQLPHLAGCQAHSSVILSYTDENVLKKLKIDVTSSPKTQAKRLYKR